MDTFGDVNDNHAVLACVLLLGLTTAAWFNSNKKQRRAPWPHVKGALPLIGNFHQIKSPAFITQKMEEWADEYGKEDGIYEMNLAGVKYVVVCREDRIQEIFSKRPFKIIRNRQVAESARSIGADGVFSAEGPKNWGAQRRMFAPAFNHSHVQDYLQHIQKVAKNLVQKWNTKRQESDDGIVIINDDCHRYTIDAVALTALGKEFDTLHQNDDCQEAHDLITVMDGALWRALSPIAYWKIPIIGQYLDGIGWSHGRLLKSMDNLVAYHKERISNNANNDHGNGEVVVASDSFVRKVLYGKNGRENDAKNVIGNLLTVFTGGTDTTAATICTCLTNLARDETGLQEELYQEIMQTDILHKDHDVSTMQDLHPSNLPKMYSFLYEIHRVFTSFPVVYLEAGVDGVPLAGRKLDKGTLLMVLMRYSTSRNPYHTLKGVPLGPNGEPATVYCPRRYYTIDGKSIAPLVPITGEGMPFLGFGGSSPRACPGQTFADAMAVVALISILKEFTLQLAPNHEPIHRIAKLAETVDKDVRIVMTPREK